MNIKEAREEIKNTLTAYHRKDAFGNYTYPLIRQRPILLIGPPGIGKTAIMEQIAEECGVGLVSYTMTHHTRQSAIGLPRILTRNYGGREVSVTEYTLSEIIASIYDYMERTGRREGILFLDEINCVSETLAPTMLQLLQSKTFGSHRVPDGWMIVAAGNPQEYNKSVREFDVVTLDRVRRIEVCADHGVWMEYAWEHGIHGAILSYLRLKKDHFYAVEKTADGPSFVTARGWEDLSELLKSYEELGVEVTEQLVIQYLQREEVAEEFAVYYRLYRKYGRDYGVLEVLEGAWKEDEYRERIRMAQNASFDERFTVIGLILEALNLALSDYERTDRQTALLHEALQHFQKMLPEKGNMESLTEFIERRKERLQVREEQGLISAEQAEAERCVIRQLVRYDAALREDHISEREQGWEKLSSLFSEVVETRSRERQSVSEKLERAFEFTADCFGEEQEMILLVSGLTGNRRAMEFIMENGCDPYFRYSEELLRHRPERELQEECRKLLTAQDSTTDCPPHTI